MTTDASSVIAPVIYLQAVVPLLHRLCAPRRDVTDSETSLDRPGRFVCECELGAAAVETWQTGGCRRPVSVARV